ncbi:ankyrin repeat domain containing protein [Pandoravirus japonicus]|uniref:Ankyrin repeat domain containing protein n=1 Tax=Pandoravirus japonicus TaxID=2823154 RepID=A0A811BMF1_9VIRU|nr:ankyrin repeat domain containing protein [Pandoravirus japonicus]
MSINDALPAEILLAVLTEPEVDPMRPVLGWVCSKWRSIVSMAPAPRRDAWSLLDGYAAERDFVGLFEWMDAIGRPRALAACQAAAAGGRTATLMWLVERGWPVDMSVYAMAARMGHASALAWLLLRPDALTMDESVLDGAISNGCTIDHLECGRSLACKGRIGGRGCGRNARGRPIGQDRDRRVDGARETTAARVGRCHLRRRLE